MPTLAAPPGVDLAAYGAQIRERFRNPALPHRTQQIAMDGSQKLPQRLLGTVRERSRRRRARSRISRSRSPAGSATRAAPTSGQRRSPCPDPLGGEVRSDRRAARAAMPSQIADGFLDLVEVFGDDLVAQRRAFARR